MSKSSAEVHDGRLLVQLQALMFSVAIAAHEVFVKPDINYFHQMRKMYVTLYRSVVIVHTCSQTTCTS